MGTTCCLTMSVYNVYNKEIERNMDIFDKADQMVKKLLLLGSGSAGKSTLFNQLKCIYDVGFAECELISCKRKIRQNVVSGMLTLLQQSEKLSEEDPEKYGHLRVNMDDEKTYAAIKLCVKYRKQPFGATHNLPKEEMKTLGECIGFLWDLEPIRATFSIRGGNFSFPDNMDYYFNKAELLYLPVFFPNREDALKTRIRTTGVMKHQYEVKEHYFHIFDVGGQRNERKKWISHFDSVTAVIYVAALNHYNAVLFEDNKTNAMHESIQLFGEVCNLKWFIQSEIILFLNKDDLFREALREGHSLKVCFHKDNGWEGDQWDADDENNEKQTDYKKQDDIQLDGDFLDFCYHQSVQFIQNQFQQRCKDPEKMIYAHVTTATNRDNTERVFWDTQNMLIRLNLKTMGIMY